MRVWILIHINTVHSNIYRKEDVYSGMSVYFEIVVYDSAVEEQFGQ